MCLILLIWHNMDSRDDVNVFTRSLKLRYEPSVMPKSLTEDTGVSSWSRKGTLMSDTLLRSCLVPKKMSLVLLGFISNWCEQHHPAMRRRSSVIFTRQEFMFLAEKEQ